MPEVIVKYKNTKALKALQDFARTFDMIVIEKKESKKQPNDLPIRFAQKPNANALSGIWKDKPLTLEELRKKAWGDRL